MKKVALLLLLSGAYSVHGTWYGKMNPVPLVKAGYGLVSSGVSTVYTTGYNGATANLWRSACVAGVLALLYKERAPIMRGTKSLLEGVGLKSKAKK